MDDKNIPKKSFCPSNKQEWRTWLEKNHQNEESVWLIMYKKNAKIPTITWSEAVDEALCFGWIDSVKKTIDNERYKQFFSKRKPNSTWSKVNKIKVAQFIEQGFITPAGLKSIEIAKENGSWTVLDEVEALVVPEDLKAALTNHKGAMEYFESLSKSNKKMLLYKVFSAKRTETRQKRIVEIAMSASKNLMS